jgi:hypothetical protein
VVERLLKLLSANADLSNPTRRALKQALVLLHREDKPASPSPVEVANRLAQVGTPAEQLNGQPAAA